MPKVTLIDENGNDLRVLTAESGLSLMETLRNSDVNDAIGMCGGICACATCQIYLDDASYKKVGSPGDFEAELILGSGVQKETSRLACQINVTDDLEGIRFAVAPLE